MESRRGDRGAVRTTEGAAGGNIIIAQCSERLGIDVKPEVGLLHACLKRDDRPWPVPKCTLVGCMGAAHLREGEG